MERPENWRVGRFAEISCFAVRLALRALSYNMMAHAVDAMQNRLGKLARPFLFALIFMSIILDISADNIMA